MMYSTYFITTVLAICISLTTFSDMTVAASFWPCKPCATTSECEEDPVDYCIWGENRDVCNRRVCSKGPGERCGGPLKILGVCGEGMMCKSDERCHGCSIQTMLCHP